MPDDIPSAARSVVTRFAAAKDAGHTDIALRMSEAAALLPVLEALAAGVATDRVERWANAMFADPERDELSAARAAIALADAEKAAEVAQGVGRV